MSRYDYIIAGAGSAGCVLANRLSEDPGTTVLLIEAGGPDRHPLVHVPKASAVLLEDEKYVWRYATTPFGPNGKSEFWTRGKLLGGSSSVNGMVYNRGQQADYDELERRGNKGWNWNQMLPIFKGFEDNQFGPSPTRGVGGPLHISVADDLDPLCGEIVAAGAASGLRAVQDINESDDERIGISPATIKNGRRVSAADAFLKPARQRPNLTVATNTIVDRIIVENGRAVGVEVRRGKSTEELRARREVIVSLGSMGSPKLLQLSGIGPREVLAAAGVPVLLERDNVGRRMREHRCVVVRFRLNADMGYNRKLASRMGQAATAARYLLTRKGLMATPTFDVLAFVKTTPDQPRVDGQLLLGPFTIPAYNEGEPMTIEREPGLSVLGFVLRPTSEGSVEITSRDPDASLRLDPNYLTSDYDRATSAALVRRAREIFAASPIADRISHELYPGADVRGDDELADAALDGGYSGYHAIGSCAMGPSDDDIVDPELRVRGIDGLRVVDCSAMPTMLAGNLNGPVMAMAWRAADLILQGCS
ncbi:choline dehydrogenase-like flavoprotein [Mycolicibacterium sp. BK634]|uniref:GMC family oxidoreductase n=1 Tax=Mycolicibacterium sp. BK634 TaxID=2587099 RepID=UPI0016178F20|nr:GMC family oxidoreductase N-terminal domain-containing protein [Mycolicibacterium sp. BK634]MBB3754452.1 choline dehydrogenase-like flavoprotein [Mycolicibacterium sp. BK634]